MANDQIDAHTQAETHREEDFYPAHEPRSTDPHYRHFQHVRREWAKEGKLVCWICGSTTHIELHHNIIEYALIGGVDLDEFEKVYPGFKALIHGSVESFKDWAEGPNNLLPLCRDHHRGPHGIHRIVHPQWEPQRYWHKGLPAPGKAI